jgi:hypothetical protein
MFGTTLLGTKTHSLSMMDSWKKVKTKISSIPNSTGNYAFMLSIDGFSNCYRDEKLFLLTALDYFKIKNPANVTFAGFFVLP